ncbi:uracil-DNA glycosylase family protein [Terrimonas alba]|uniref:uracil-DNA glycosylase family protein n=1 Tax=Terrimonas alba TaxID=3349636 RepID=UPI0035F23E89
MPIEFDKGPSPSMARLLQQHPDYSPVKELFWFNWGPVFYRGRLDKSAKILCVASDPGPTERIGGRALIGNAGQRVQGFLSKIGITRSYVCLNGFVYSLHPSNLSDGLDLLVDPAHTRWRNKVFTKATGPALRAIVAFGEIAKQTIRLWPGKGDTPVFETYHPSYSHDEAKLTADWNRLVSALRNIVTKDEDGDTDGALYGTRFTEADYAPVPRRDLPFGAPAFLGDDSWLRTTGRGRMNSVSRPSGDDLTLTWKAPDL